jgi:hypothetical protein
MIANKIREISNHFKGKIVLGDYKLAYWGDFSCEVLVENYYTVSLWHRGGEESFGVFNSDKDLILKDIKFTDAEKSLAWKALNKHKSGLNEARINRLEQTIKDAQDKIKWIKEHD